MTLTCHCEDLCYKEQFDYKIKNLTISRDYHIERHFSLLNEYLKMANNIQVDSYLGVMAAYNRSVPIVIGWTSTPLFYILLDLFMRNSGKN